MNIELSSDQRNWATISHLCGLLWLAGGPGLIFVPFGSLVLLTILGPLIIWKTKGEALPFVAEQAKESLNFQITVFLAGLVCAILCVIVVGFALLWLLGLANLVLVIIAAIQTTSGKPYRYPFCLRLVR